MITGILSFVLDLLVMALLGATIYYAIRLSRMMNEFRQARQAFQQTVETLSRDILRAEQALSGLKGAAQAPAGQAQKTLNESRFLLHELQAMNEAGTSLAKRLEALAEKNSRIAQASERVHEYRAEDFDSAVGSGESARPSFFIQDRDYGRDEDAAVAGWEDEMDETLQSQAERELMRALRRHEKKKPPGKTYS